MKERILQCFNKGAETYDAAAIVQKKIADRLATRLPKMTAKNILEIGCGTGYFSQVLLNHYPHASYLLTDIAPAMIAVCKNRFSTNTQVRIACIDGEGLMPSSHFDLIVSNMTLHWFTNIKTSFDNIIEKIAPNGQFKFAMLGENSLIEWRDIFEKNNLQIPTPLFPSRKILLEHFPKLQIETEVIQQVYKNTYDFIKSLKKIGATATYNEYLPLSSGRLRKLLRQSAQPITISYEIIYGTYIKS